MAENPKNWTSPDLVDTIDRRVGSYDLVSTESGEVQKVGKSKHPVEAHRAFAVEDRTLLGHFLQGRHVAVDAVELFFNSSNAAFDLDVVRYRIEMAQSLRADFNAKSRALFWT